jgi:hypothetical protein
VTEHGWPGPDWADDQADDQHGSGHPDHGWADPHPADAHPAGPAWSGPDNHWPDPGHDPQAGEQAAGEQTAGYQWPGHDTAPHDTAPQETLAPGGAAADTAGSGMGHAGADPDALHDPGAPEPGDGFPPPVDVGALPQPVDGFPWADPGTLGDVPVPDRGAPGAADPAGLAAYAAQDLDPGHDPWDQLAASDDPATAALARFWRPAG